MKDNIDNYPLYPLQSKGTGDCQENIIQDNDHQRVYDTTYHNDCA